MFGARSGINVTFAPPVTTAAPAVESLEMCGAASAALFEIRADG